MRRSVSADFVTTCVRVYDYRVHLLRYYNVAKGKHASRQQLDEDVTKEGGAAKRRVGVDRQKAGTGASTPASKKAKQSTAVHLHAEAAAQLLYLVFPLRRCESGSSSPHFFLP